jgi:hypothetical protein
MLLKYRVFNFLAQSAMAAFLVLVVAAVVSAYNFG